MMQHIIRVIPRLVMPHYVVFIFSIVLLIVWGTQAGVNRIINENTVAWEGQCSFSGWDKTDNAGVIIDCGEMGKVTLGSMRFVSSYFQNPGPVVCRLNTANDITCDNRPPPGSRMN